MSTVRVVIVHLISGEEVIAKVKYGVDQTIELTDPFLVAALEGRLGMAQFSPFKNHDATIFIKPEHVLFVVDPVAALVNQYLEIVSPLTLPQHGGLLVPGK